jgi:phosphoserine phosphatase
MPGTVLLLTRRSILAAAALLPAVSASQAVDPLPSWNDTKAKQMVLAFVSDVTAEGGRNHVAPGERIAVFDNDGTLWAEQPIYFQLAFALDRVRTLAPQHPEWQTQPPFNAALKGDLKAVAASGKQGLLDLITATHTGMTPDEFKAVVREWLASARHPRFKRPYTELVFQPMLELLTHLRANGFKTYIVSGGTVEFMRAWAEAVYGIPPEQVIGTTFATRFDTSKGAVPRLVRNPKIEFVDDGPGKPIAIQRHIGRQPILAFGNSDGDLQMLQWTAAGSGRRFMGLVHHTDAHREWAYDRVSKIGRLDKALNEAAARGWGVVDMQRDWRKIFPFE